MKTIPFDPSISSVQSFNVNLGELVCDFLVSWNHRDGHWYSDFVTSYGANYSVKLVENSPLLGAANRTTLAGDFRILKMNRLAEDRISYDNFGSDWLLVYGTTEEWEKFDADT